MHEYTAGYAVAVYPGESLPASFSVIYDSPYKEYIKEYHYGRAYESPFLTDGAENEVCTLFRHETERRLCAVEISLSEQTSGTDSDHGLIHIITYTGRIFLHSEKYLDTLSLMILKHIIEKEIGRKDQSDSGNLRQYGQKCESASLSVSLVYHERKC